MLYSIKGDDLEQIKKVNFNLERDLQRLTEKNLEKLFNLKFVASEFQIDDLRIDSLAYNEETKSFVIIEYKNVRNLSLIDQGYSYLSLILNNKAEFTLKYNQAFSTNYDKSYFDFSQTIVMFISPNYTKYQLRAIEFKDLPFELWKVVKYDNDTISYEHIDRSENKASIKQLNTNSKALKRINKEIIKYSEEDLLKGRPDEIKEFYYTLKENVETDYDDISSRITKTYSTLRTNNQIIASVQPRKDDLKITFNLKNSEIDDPQSKTKDVRNINNTGIGTYELILKVDDDLDYFFYLFKQAYNEKI